MIPNRFNFALWKESVLEDLEHRKRDIRYEMQRIEQRYSDLEQELDDIHKELLDLEDREGFGYE